MKKVVVIGTGRVGLPLLLAFASEGYKVTACDINEETLQAIKNKKMPFEETGCQELLEKLDPIDTCDVDNIPKAEYYIITCGTPVRQHFEADFTAVTEAIGNLIDYDLLQPNTTLILRSTLAPGTTDYIKKFLKSQNIDCKIAMCPERLAEGKALKELYKLPQIIGAYDDASFESAKALFECFGTEAIRVLPKEAELCKLLCNTYRYINFAIPNYFMYVLNSFGIENPLEVIQKAAKDYPRMAALAGPGPCGGTCLVKDPLMINEFFPQVDFALQAYKVHEYMPKFMTQLAGDLEGKHVIVLGYTFKKDTDDTRDSKVPKLIRYIEKQVPKRVAVIEPHLYTGLYDDIKWNDMLIENCLLNSRLIKSMTVEKYIVIIGTPHSEFLKPEYQELMKNAEKVVDVTGLIWKN